MKTLRMTLEDYLKCYNPLLNIKILQDLL